MREVAYHIVMIIEVLISVFPYANVLIMQSYSNTQIAWNKITVRCIYPTRVVCKMGTGILRYHTYAVLWNKAGFYLPLSFAFHDDVIKWKHFPRNWPFVREIHRSPVNFPHKGQWRGALMFSLIYVWINDWVNNREAGDLRRQQGHYDVIVMYVDDLISGLERFGCNVANEYYSNTSVTKDLTLLCPSFSGLQKMLNIGDVFFDRIFCEI